MITTLFVIFCAYLITKANISISLKFEPALEICLALICILTVMFKVFHGTLLKGEKRDRYDYIWDEPHFSFYGILYVIVDTILLLILEENYVKEETLLGGTLIFFGFLIILDVANIPIMYFTYSYRVKESIIDSFLFQIKMVRSSIVVILSIVCILEFTMFGFLIILLIIGIIASFL